jgi:hypothetical protein
VPLIEINPPAGFVNHGTDLQSEGRWRDGSLVRWDEGGLRPISGWVDRVGSVVYAAPPRGMLAWETSSTRWIAAGTYSHLYVTTSAGTTSDITPVGYTAGVADAAVNTGYGGGAYGTGFYGQVRQDTGNYSEATTWSLDTWGQYLVGCAPTDGKIYEWQLDSLTPAVVIANAPIDNAGIVVTEDRFLFALGAGGDPRKIAWCDFEDNTTWASSSTNQAGDIILQTTGRVMGGVRMQGQTLILTDQDAHRAVYVGAPFIFQFERVGSSCGLVARKALADTPRGAGSSVSEIPCSVSDYVFDDINTAQISKSWAVTNGQNGEVWWFYPSAGSLECDSYVAFDYAENHWLIGKLSRTAGFDRGVFRAPIWGSTNGRIYNHETGFNYDGLPVYAETGPFKIGAGDNLAVLTQLIPDETNLGDVTATLKTRLYPTATESAHGPFSLTNPTSLRVQGRQIRMRLDGAVLGVWRVGKFRFDVTPGSKR